MTAVSPWRSCGVAHNPVSPLTPHSKCSPVFVSILSEVQEHRGFSASHRCQRNEAMACCSPLQNKKTHQKDGSVMFPRSLSAQSFTFRCSVPISIAMATPAMRQGKRLMWSSLSPLVICERISAAGGLWSPDNAYIFQVGVRVINGGCDFLFIYICYTKENSL